ncbi:hypothetical protein QBC32DRAFT_349409 [Pseudoneurospora amorphoporcata]|uniref:Pentatricopeptide repeat domain-containing protein n=1 Tax=Pseudoneurospora amorphoporcata TaxID=241081 RepID=A0AAN6NQK5_9PEZI|nr:hypothetical protein QBC32DRAFT_349409 [Pseudoneurospora amorphoporcata]
MRAVPPVLRHVARPGRSTISHLYTDAVHLQASGRPGCVNFSTRARWSRSLMACTLDESLAAEEDPGVRNTKTAEASAVQALPGQASNTYDLSRWPGFRTSRNHPFNRDDWGILTATEEDLRFQCDVLADTPKDGQPRLVDWPQYANDMTLWSCILEHRQRTEGDVGVAAVLEGLQKRRALKEVEGQIAEQFWQTILDVAVRDQEILHSAWLYAEWLYSDHGVLWPNLYAGVVSFFIGKQDIQSTLIWHLRLSSSFCPDSEPLSQVLKQFITNSDAKVREILQALYMTSVRQNLYDLFIPYLFAQGEEGIARDWRRLFISHHDFPTTTASRPFLQFLVGFHPKIQLTTKEQSVLTQSTHALLRSVELNKPLRDNHSQVDVSFDYQISKSLGNVFGIKEQTDNDSLGAIWFAALDFSIETIIGTVSSLGFSEIGPLSLQAIARREPSPDRLLHHIAQLQESGIGIGNSTYSKTLQHLAIVGDEELFEGLVYTTMHPEEFDNFVTHPSFLRCAAAERDFMLCRLLLEASHLKTTQLLEELANEALLVCLKANSASAMVGFFDIMADGKIEMMHSTADAISQHICEEIVPRPGKDRVNISSYATMHRRLLRLGYPLTAEASQIILFRLGREGLHDERDDLALDIVSFFEGSLGPEKGSFRVHKLDLPDAVAQQLPKSEMFMWLPSKLSTTSPCHPLHIVFSSELLGSMIRWGFRSSRGMPWNGIEFSKPADFFFARGIKLVAMLKERGVRADDSFVRSVIVPALTVLLISGEIKRFHRPQKDSHHYVPPKVRETLSLKEAIRLCNLAYGSYVLERLPELIHHSMKEWKLKLRQTQPELFIPRKREYAVGSMLWVKYGPGGRPPFATKLKHLNRQQQEGAEASQDPDAQSSNGRKGSKVKTEDDFFQDFEGFHRFLK